MHVDSARARARARIPAHFCGESLCGSYPYASAFASRHEISWPTRWQHVSSSYRVHQRAPCITDRAKTISDETKDRGLQANAQLFTPFIRRSPSISDLLNLTSKERCKTYHRSFRTDFFDESKLCSPRHAYHDFSEFSATALRSFPIRTRFPFLARELFNESSNPRRISFVDSSTRFERLVVPPTGADFTYTPIN